MKAPMSRNGSRNGSSDVQKGLGVELDALLLHEPGRRRAAGAWSVGLELAAVGSLALDVTRLVVEGRFFDPVVFERLMNRRS